MRGKYFIFDRVVRGLTSVALMVMLGLCPGAFYNPAMADEARGGFEPAAVDKIYADLGEDSIWWTPATGLTARGKIIVDFLSHADREGLRPSDYLPSNNDKNENLTPETAPQNYDRSFTTGLLRYISDIRDGRLAARYVDPELFDIPNPTNATALLKTGLQTADFQAWLESLPPQSLKYKNLKEYLERYRKIADMKWPLLNTDQKLELGSSDPNVPHVRARLKILGDFPADNDETNDVFDNALFVAVERFQNRNGLTPDGIIGPETYAALNVSPASIIQKITINLERLRQLPESLGSRYVMVNVPGFDLTAVSDGVEKLHMRVIVGQQKRRTPILNDKITSIKFRPTWTVPVKIAREDLLPKIKADVNYLLTSDFRVFTSWKKDAPEIDPQGVDWRIISPERLNYKFVQNPGPSNALGQIRFTLTNPYDIYLHDTPNKNLFNKSGRAISSGCIRVADPLTLADFLMEPSAKWTVKSIQEVMAAGEKQVIKLPAPIPVYITYFTAAVDEAGQLQLWKDVYGRDADLIYVLKLGTVE
ncbi:L,D-transpeptidase family protein [Sneathiella sp. HT1-7]|uniref:L,D-transpeptidase family protein n=1 Tax=Sneathiella sp. HT1-7 TaxID=2887192 RepID=UPI001D1451A0|nr:L,D-transpeptidase family protein [Sneathiella sp. HT1-7]MCC3304324.1 L,D-transpeptidase family protein [Sneathiella sp. HT1-7]